MNLLERPGSKVESLSMVRSDIRAEVYERYKALKGRSVAEESARNTAAAQCSTMPKAKHRAAVYRRELDALLAPPKRRETPAESPYNWRNPL